MSVSYKLYLSQFYFCIYPNFLLYEDMSMRTDICDNITKPLQAPTVSIYQKNDVVKIIFTVISKTRNLDKSAMQQLYIELHTYQRIYPI